MIRFQMEYRMENNLFGWHTQVLLMTQKKMRSNKTTLLRKKVYIGYLTIQSGIITQIAKSLYFAHLDAVRRNVHMIFQSVN